MQRKGTSDKAIVTAHCAGRISVDCGSVHVKPAKALLLSKDGALEGAFMLNFLLVLQLSVAVLLLPLYGLLCSRFFSCGQLPRIHPAHWLAQVLPADNGLYLPFLKSWQKTLFQAALH